ncbi:MAG: cobalamin biosynthesis protein [Lachnospiraceae bacterium]|nr:cobalamin biosynthesis protein [Lachnospiraceae bacterium]
MSSRTDRNIRILCFTDAGEQLAKRIAEGLAPRESGFEEAALPGSSQEIRWERCGKDSRISLEGWTREAFAGAFALIFIGACGIAVRAIAPFVKSKVSDPAVIVVDERGENVISLLSGHLGGANELTKRIAEITGGRPVITTATDINGKFAVDTWAKDQGLVILNPEKIKEISKTVLRGKTLRFQSVYPIRIEETSHTSFLWNTEDGSVRELSKEPILTDELPTILIDLRKSAGALDNNAIDKSLWLCPKTACLGIGCKKGVSGEQIGRAFEVFLKSSGIYRECIVSAASIELKRGETGLIDFCEKNGFPVEFFSAAQLNELSGEFSASDFVKETTGVDCVSERSAVYACIKALPQGKEVVSDSRAGSAPDFLIERKFSKNGVTFALAAREELLVLSSVILQRDLRGE